MREDKEDWLDQVRVGRTFWERRRRRSLEQNDRIRGDEIH